MAEVTWRALLTEALKERGEDWDAVVHTTLTQTQMDVQFDNGYGAPEGVPFALWTTRYVYFPTDYDGSESVQSVPRNPSSEFVNHTWEDDAAWAAKLQPLAP